jgi:uncharacterized membrane protein YjjP (DUF1212 family)
MTDSEIAFGEACGFMVKVGKAAHSYGSTSSRIESYLGYLASALGYQGTFTQRPPRSC